ncbi:MAG: hypothetical protein AAB394_00645 [Patescibacteria group bacterium]
MLAKLVVKISEKTEGDMDTLNESLPKLFQDRDENIVISSEEFDLVKWNIILKAFEMFPKKVHKLSENLSRFAIDKEKGTITIIGNNNRIEIG